MTQDEVAGAATRSADLARLRADAGRRVAAVATAVSVATAAWPDATAGPDIADAWPDAPGPPDLAAPPSAAPPSAGPAIGAGLRARREPAPDAPDALDASEADALRLYEQAVLALAGRDRGPGTAMTTTTTERAR
jgi:hypothetical protein